MTIDSHRHIACIIDGERQTGWAAEDEPVVFPEITITEVEVGKDGTLQVTDTGHLGGEVELKFASNSPSVGFWLKRFTDRQRGVRHIFEGSYSDPERGIACTMSGGVLMTEKPMKTPGQTFVVKLHFQEIIPDVDAAQWATLPTNAAL